MINDKLKELCDFVEEIDKTRPVELLESNIKNFQDEIENLSNFELNLKKSFNRDLIKIIEQYKSQGFSNSLILFEAYAVLIGFLRNSLIEEKAEALGVDKKLYKNDMKLLFKGKKT